MSKVALGDTVQRYGTLRRKIVSASRCRYPGEERRSLKERNEGIVKRKQKNKQEVLYKTDSDVRTAKKKKNNTDTKQIVCNAVARRDHRNHCACARATTRWRWTQRTMVLAATLFCLVPRLHVGIKLTSL